MYGDLVLENIEIDKKPYNDIITCILFFMKLVGILKMIMCISFSILKVVIMIY